MGSDHGIEGSGIDGEGIEGHVIDDLGVSDLGVDDHWFAAGAHSRSGSGESGGEPLRLSGEVAKPRDGDRESRNGNSVANPPTLSTAPFPTLRLARRQVCKDVTLWPLLIAGEAHDDSHEGGSAPAGPRELWPLEEALEDGWVGVSAGVSPGAVRIESRAAAPVWVGAGEALGVAGFSAGSRLIPPHGSAEVRVAAEGQGHCCSRCSGELARGFSAIDGQVGFVVAVHDRAVGLEVVLPGAPLARRLRQRVEAWAPFLLSREVDSGRVGLDSPEALITAAFQAPRGPSGCGGARVSILRG